MMQVSVEQTTTLGRKLTVSVPSEEVEMAVDRRLVEIAKQAKLDGFRQGKVPTRIIKMRYGAGVREEIVSDLVKKHLQAAVDQEDLKLAGVPDLNVTEQTEGQDLQFEAEIELYPEFELAEIEGLEIIRETSSLDDAAIDKRIDAT